MILKKAEFFTLFLQFKLEIQDLSFSSHKNQSIIYTDIDYISQLVGKICASIIQDVNFMSVLSDGLSGL